VSVQPAKSSVARGQTAAYAVKVSTENGSAADVSVTLTTQPSNQKPTFTSGCTKGDKTATCTVASVSDQKSVDLKAQIPVSSSATSVSSVKLTATASVVTTVTWTPPAAAETVAVTAAPAAPAAPAASAAGATPETLPLGPVPELNGVSSSLIGAGNASGLFPAISPSAASSPAASAGVGTPGSRRNAAPISDSSTLAPVLTAQIAGLIALAAAIMLTVTRLSLRRRFRSRKQSS
jgi:hypothetical protein